MRTLNTGDNIIYPGEKIPLPPLYQRGHQKEGENVAAIMRFFG
jgi:hypothetical protein